MATITFKVSEREAARIRRLARRAGVTVSAYLRQRAIPGDSPSSSAGAYRVARSPVTGLPVMHAPPGAAPVTSEQVRELLADFP